MGDVQAKGKESMGKKFLSFFSSLRHKLNQTAGGRYSPDRIALYGMIVTGIIVFQELFLYHVLGVGDDGSLSSIMKQTGLTYTRADATQPVGAYFVRTYVKTSPQHGGVSLHRNLIETAMLLDDLFTGDGLFDIRFLGAIYLILYLPAVWLFMSQLLRRVKYTSEGIFLAAVCVLVFSDAGYTTYFNSLYPEPLWMILMILIFASLLGLQMRDPGRCLLFILLGTAAGACLALTESHLAVVSAVLGIFDIILMADSGIWGRVRAAAGASAFFLLILSPFSWNNAANRFTVDSKMNAMTLGVLMESTDPAETLSEFGIDRRFEVLADTSQYTDFPVVLTGNEDIRENFLARYSEGDIAMYYLRHPSAMLSLLSLASKAAFQVRRNYIGNYERSAGLPGRARTPLFSLYSNYKGAAVPKTLGFLLILTAEIGRAHV